MRGPSAWLAEISGLGRAFVEVLAAEWATLSDDLGASGRHLVRGAILALVAGGLLGWSVVLLSLALIAFLERYMEPWLATTVVAAGLMLAAAALLLRARSVLRRVRPPGEVVQTHVRNHLDWLGTQLEGVDASSGQEGGDDVRG